MTQQAAIVLKNVFQFATILNQASNADVQKWDGPSVSNALDWAEYCHELYVRLKGLPSENDFNSQLAQMTMLLTPVSCLHLTLDALQNAKYLLVNTLVCNSKLSTQLHRKLEAALSNSQDGNEILSKIQQQASSLKTAENFFESLRRPSADASGTSQDRAEFHANFLVLHLTNIVSCAKKKDRFESYCHAVCDKLMQSPQGDNVFVHLFNCKLDEKVEPERRKWLRVLHHHLISWLQRQIRQNALSCPLLKADVEDVVQAASIHPEVFKIYLDVLSTWTDSCVPEIHRPGCLVWVSPDGSNSQRVSHHFQCLLSRLSSSNDQLRRNQVINLIVRRVQGREFSAWRSLAISLLHMLKQG
ncbi:hypothetical protein RRG08_007503 [Elysia crispata]|uniref:Uncharacterized protein n=1 Tax=Elysia crispata TaxID=231223 RepID=A0AAE0ZGM6_9GAST|nr:hypothetical protein RRG08_007503 [Elysia crispata]